MKIRNLLRNAFLAFGCSFVGLTLTAWIIWTMDGSRIHAFSSLIGMLAIGSIVCAACFSALYVSTYIVDARVPPGCERETLFRETFRGALVIIVTFAGATLFLKTLAGGSFWVALTSPQWLESMLGIAAASGLIGLSRLQQLSEYVEPSLSDDEHRVRAAFVRAGGLRRGLSGALTLTSNRLVFRSMNKLGRGDETIPLPAIKSVSRRSFFFGPRDKLVVDTPSGERTFLVVDADGWIQAISTRSDVVGAFHATNAKV